MLHELLNFPIGTSSFFRWKEALFLKEWQTFALPPTREIEENIMEVAKRMDLIREHLSRPLIVTSWFRPFHYNKQIGGTRQSQHLIGRACDFVAEGLDCDYVRAVLQHRLEDFNIRMENLPGSSWVHIDVNCTENMPRIRRYFSP